MDHVVGVLFVGVWVVLCAAVVVRLVVALRRRRSGSSLRDSVLRPVASAGTLAVWPIRDPRTRRHLEHGDGGAAHRTETPLVEPSPDERDQARDQRPGQSRE